MQALTLLFLALYLLVTAWHKRLQAESGHRGRAWMNREVSLRSIVLAVLVPNECLFLAVFFSVLIHPFAAAVQTSWLSKSIEYVIPAFIALGIVLYASPWLAWRICRPVGPPWLCRFVYWFTPFAWRKELDDFALLLRASKGMAPEPPPTGEKGIGVTIRKLLLLYRRPPFIVDSWAVLMLALARAAQGDPVRAEHLLRTFSLCPPGLSTLGRLRRFAFEELAWHAARRKDWDAVVRILNWGGGTRASLLRLVAEKHLGRRVSSIGLWLAWAISPSRRRAFRFVREAIREAGSRSACPERSPGMWDGLRLSHLRLLLKASEGEYVGMEEVLRLAQSWAREFTDRKPESLLRRGMELGARNVFGIAENIEESILDELEEITSAAEGDIPEELLADAKAGQITFVTKLVLRLRNRLYEDVRNLQELFKVEDGETVADKDLLNRWETWLALHQSVSRLQQMIGTDELATLWYGTMRYVVWNSTSLIFNGSDARTAFVSMIMFRWLVEICELLDDEEGLKQNRDNVKICFDELWLNRRTSKKLSAWAA